MPSHSNETNHFVVATVQNGDIEGCPSKEECSLWASGLLTIERPIWSTTCKARLALTGAGCEVCSDPIVTQGDLRVLRDFSSDVPDMQDVVPMLKEVAQNRLAEEALRFRPDGSTNSIL